MMKFLNIKTLIFLIIIFYGANYLIKYEPKIIYSNPSIISTLKTKPVTEIPSIKILAFGDLMLGRYVETLISRGENMFENLSPEIFKNQDFIFANLENPITLSEMPLDKSITLKMNPKNISILRENNINLVSLANNHMEDFLQKGINDTLNYLDQNSIEHFGIQNQPLIQEENGIKLAFFGINALWGDITPFYNLIQETALEVDHVVVSIHWGYEYNSLPSEIQTEIGHKLIDFGASIVLGHHPHTTQSIEIYKKGVIFYSLGNFIFDQVDPITFKELGVEMNIEKEKIYFRLLPMTVKNFKPELLLYDEAILECQNLTPGIKLNDDCMFSIDVK